MAKVLLGSVVGVLVSTCQPPYFVGIGMWPSLLATCWNLFMKYSRKIGNKIIPNSFVSTHFLDSIA